MNGFARTMRPRIAVPIPVSVLVLRRIRSIGTSRTVRMYFVSNERIFFY